MFPEIRILIFEDKPETIICAKDILKSAGLSFISMSVKDKAVFLEELEEFLPDMILYDDSSGWRESLLFSRALFPRIPFIIMLDSDGDNIGEFLECGITNHVIKTNLLNLGSDVWEAMKAIKYEREQRNTRKFMS